MKLQDHNHHQEQPASLQLTEQADGKLRVPSAGLPGNYSQPEAAWRVSDILKSLQLPELL